MRPGKQGDPYQRKRRDESAAVGEASVAAGRSRRGGCHRCCPPTAAPVLQGAKMHAQGLDRGPARRPHSPWPPGAGRRLLPLSATWPPTPSRAPAATPGHPPPAPGHACQRTACLAVLAHPPRVWPQPATRAWPRPAAHRRAPPIWMRPGRQCSAQRMGGEELRRGRRDCGGYGSGGWGGNHLPIYLCVPLLSRATKILWAAQKSGVFSILAG